MTFRPSLAAALACLLAAIPGNAATRPAETTGRYAAQEHAPYVAEEVVIPCAGYSLAGTLTRPRMHSKSPAAVLINGSGAQDRDNTTGGSDYRPFYQIADALSRSGIAALRLDSRGVGGSTGSLEGLTTADKAADTRAALAFLRKRADIDAARLVLIGQSEGALIAPMVAMTDPGLRGIVLLCSPGRSGRDVVLRQRREGADHDPSVPDSMRDSVFSMSMQAWDQHASEDKWSGFFSTYDPITTAVNSKAPVLLLQGGADEAIAPDDAERLATAFRKASKDVTVKTLEGLMHSMLRASSFGPDGSPKPGGLELPRELLEVVVDWVTPHVK